MNDNSATNLYLSEMGKHDLLTEEEEIELARRIADGDKKAKNKLVKANLRYVVHIVRKVFWKHSDIEEDLIQGGNVGLVKAVEKFDPQLGRFSTYATWWIKHGVFETLAKSKPRTLTSAKTNKVTSLLRVCRECLIVDMHTDESITIITNEFNRRYSNESDGKYTEDDIKQIQNDYNISYSVSLDKPSFDDSESTMVDSIVDMNTRSPQMVVSDMLTHTKVGGLVNQLDDIEEYVVTKRFGLDGEGVDTLEEVSEQVDIPREKVRQIEARALRKLKRIMLEPRIRGEI